VLSKNALFVSTDCSKKERAQLLRIGISGPMIMFPPVYKPAPEKRASLAIWITPIQLSPGLPKAGALSDC
jgi:hypothetical protein